MDKRCILVNPSASVSELPASVDWQLCTVCQENTREKLNRSVLSDAGYRTFAEILPQSEKLWALPPSLVLSRIDERDGLLAAFVKYYVKWHQSCHNKFSSRELQRKIAPFETACLSTLDSSELGKSSIRGRFPAFCLCPRIIKYLIQCLCSACCYSMLLLQKWQR